MIRQSLDKKTHPKGAFFWKSIDNGKKVGIMEEKEKRGRRMRDFERAKWIWVARESLPDSYGEFYDEFSWEGGKCEVLLSCDGDYTLFVNGQFVASNQYGDFEWYKSVDELDVTPYLRKGKNSIAVLVWHFGVDTQRYFHAQAGLIFELFVDGKSVLSSGENTCARYSKAYTSGAQKFITVQLGFSFSYDEAKEDAWKTEKVGYHSAVLVDKKCDFVARPIDKLEIQPRAKATCLKAEGNYYLIDLGEERVGLPTLEFFSETAQKIRVDWGEDLQDGHVRRIIGDRDFSFNYSAKAGKNEYTNYMLRLGCRYLEVYAEKPIALEYAGLLPQVYPTKKKGFALENALDQRIYNTCVNTLNRSMMEHYVDTPWREQCLYVFDSRNQMLCGYYAFEDKNARYARSNLQLISKDRREDGLLSICYPCGMDLTIPSFSLYYFMAVREYVEYTGDVSLAREVYPKLRAILDVFLGNREDGLVCAFVGRNHWNLYDWSEYLSDPLRDAKPSTPDLILNALFILALENLRVIDEKLGNEFAFDGVLSECKKRTRETFFRAQDGAFAFSKTGKEYTALGNALAVLAGLTNETETRFICEKLINGEFLECSLSMKCFKYDAVISALSERGKAWVLSEIRKDYGKMLDIGATTVWETIDGASAFGNAGSLCHGWSATPIYYYHKWKA